MRRTVTSIVLSLVLARMAAATTIDPLTWQELVLGADFLGVVECEVAGGIVAKYRVIESWKGAAAGQQVSLEIAANAWEPQFPIVLCGERFLAAGYKMRPATMMSTTSYGAVPLWWRRIPADFKTPVFQGMAKISGTEADLTDFRVNKSSLETFKRDASGLLAQPPDKQEELLLKAQAEKYLGSDQSMYSLSHSSRAAELNSRIARAEGASEVVALLLDEAARADEEVRNAIDIVFSRGGGSIALAAVEQLTSKTSPFKAEDRKRIVESIRYRLGSRGEPRTASREKPSPPTRKALATARASLQRGKSSSDIGQAIELLTTHDPERVAKFLRDWVNPKRDWWDHDAGYALGSYFAWRCSRHRTQNLTTLLTARDPFIRVAGAVYLCFENRELGLQKLEEFSQLDGDPGVWAALNRARRGDKSAVPRALEALRTSGAGDMTGVLHRNFQKRVVVLLSNSARASGVDQPPVGFSDEENEGARTKMYDFYKSWWDANAEKLVVSDPWLPLLEEQKVD